MDFISLGFRVWGCLVSAVSDDEGFLVGGQESAGLGFRVQGLGFRVVHVCWDLYRGPLFMQNMEAYLHITL